MGNAVLDTATKGRWCSFGRPVLLCCATLAALATSRPEAMAAGAIGVREHYPAKQWEHVSSPESLGWSSAKLAQAKQYADSIDTAAVMIIDHGLIVSEWGNTARKYNVHSIRKSFVSALYGIAANQGAIRLASTLQDLGIDDNAPSLTADEKRTRVIDLLKARSGIYHPAVYETPGMTKMKPARASHPPNTFWYYNNWDFNALGTILEQQTKRSVFELFNDEIAAPLGMEDFSTSDADYDSDVESIHRAYVFRMTARDMARFGLLYLRQGRWRGKQIIPKEWIRASTTAYSVADGEAHKYDGYAGYGYLWWVGVNGNLILNARLPDGSFAAEGYRGHYIVVIPALDLVVVHRVDTDRPWPSPGAKAVGMGEFGKLLQLILDARHGTPVTINRTGSQVVN
jgi:CubicO group peptidase (beta-lactamase class C family)